MSDILDTEESEESNNELIEEVVEDLVLVHDVLEGCHRDFVSPLKESVL